MGRPKKKVILFIVEGPSDKAALERPIQELLDGNEDGVEATFLVAESDVTSDYRNNPDNILDKINKWYFMPFFQANEFCYPKDILEVVQICDLDGAYISEENCLQYDENHWADDGFVYEPPYIYGETSESIITRNRRKAENINFLLTQESIKLKTKTKPYHLYYFSSNIDHYLHNRLNLCGRDKVELAEKYADINEGSSTAFLKTLENNDEETKDLSYEETWSFIKEGTHSIERHTNFDLYVKSLLQRFVTTNEA